MYLHPAEDVVSVQIVLPAQLPHSHFLLGSLSVARIASPCHGLGRMVYLHPTEDVVSVRIVLLAQLPHSCFLSGSHPVARIASPCHGEGGEGRMRPALLL